MVQLHVDYVRSGEDHHIQLPAAVVGNELYVRAVLKGRDNKWIDTEAVQTSLYQNILEGQWIAPAKLGTMANRPAFAIQEFGDRSDDFAYGAMDQHRLWEVFIRSTVFDTHTEGHWIMEIEIEYPSKILQREDGRGYVFQVALERYVRQADWTNRVSDGEVKDDAVLSCPTEYWLKLAVPG